MLMSDTFPIKSWSVAGPENLERASLADRVRSDEDPVLPRRESPENARLHRLRAPESQTRLHTGERVGRKAGALLDAESNLVVPVESVGRRRHQPHSARFGCREGASYRAARLLDGV